MVQLSTNLYDHTESKQQLADDPKKEDRANWCLKTSDNSFLQLMCVSEQYIYVPSHTILELSHSMLKDRVKMLYESSARVRGRITFEQWLVEQRAKYAQLLCSKSGYHCYINTGFIDQMRELESYGSYYLGAKLDYCDKAQGAEDLKELGFRKKFIRISDFSWNHREKTKATNILNNNNNEQVSTDSIGVEQHQRGSCISSPGRESEIATSTGFIGNAFCIIRRPVIVSESTQSGSVFQQEHPGSQTESGRFDEWSGGSRITTKGPVRRGIYGNFECVDSSSVRRRE